MNGTIKPLKKKRAPAKLTKQEQRRKHDGNMTFLLVSCVNMRKVKVSSLLYTHLMFWSAAMRKLKIHIKLVNGNA